jgi:Stf0 sulphotransferase
LCGLLAGTGLAGRPEEYFWRDDEPDWSQRWSVEGFADCLRAAIAQGTTPNGVFGAKVMFGYLPDLLGKLAALPGNQGRSDRGAAGAGLPEPAVCLDLARGRGRPGGLVVQGDPDRRVVPGRCAPGGRHPAAL